MQNFLRSFSSRFCFFSHSFIIVLSLFTLFFLHAITFLRSFFSCSCFFRALFSSPFCFLGYFFRFHFSHALFSSSYHFFARFCFFCALFLCTFDFFALLLFCALFSSLFCALFSLGFRLTFASCLGAQTAKKVPTQDPPLGATEPDCNRISSGIYRKTATSCCVHVTRYIQDQVPQKVISFKVPVLMDNKGSA